ncbi:Teashirt-like protein 1 [Frankliniella fusca]|uniref:Teashirt-like protein 1 n=1 Tax=Frankliniella fusca TaxID=407009 RepID=A0AAE1HQB3_9NEOP|nr:Teashirt-like protein 1 [Frankliniella fusca]
MPIGNYTASQSHLRILIKSVEKEKHGLTEYDLDKQDKMNFNSSVKICSERITNLLEGTTPDTPKIHGRDGTVAYLTAMRYLVEACLNDSLSPSEKLYKIWYCTYFLRFWKLWLMNHSSYNMENFVSSNLYLCVEVISHALTLLLMRYRDKGKPEFFITNLYSSQPCESFFRLSRSLTSTFSTVINFCMKDFLAKVRLIDMLHHVTAKLSEKFVFPRGKRKKLLSILTKEKLESAYMPNDDEICNISMQAKRDVILCLNKLGIKSGVNTSLVTVSEYVTSCKKFEDDDELTYNVCDNYCATMDEDDIPLDIVAAFPTLADISELDFQDSSELLSPDGPFVFVKKSSDGFTSMRKSTFCWLLVKTGAKLSNDRLEKVRQAVCYSFRDFSSHQDVHRLPCKESEVEIGDWCVFKHLSNFLFGQILQFSYLSGKSRSYTLNKAPTTPPKNCKTVRGLGCLCTFYNVKSDGKVTQINVSYHTYKNIDQYVIATIRKPSCIHEVFSLSPEALTFFRNLSR